MIHICHLIFAQDYINRLKKKKHFVTSIKESNIETIRANQTKKVFEQWKMHGHSVSMDRTYTSPKLFILLKEKY